LSSTVRSFSQASLVPLQGLPFLTFYFCFRVLSSCTEYIALTNLCRYRRLTQYHSFSHSFSINFNFSFSICKECHHAVNDSVVNFVIVVLELRSGSGNCGRQCCVRTSRGPTAAFMLRRRAIGEYLQGLDSDFGLRDDGSSRSHQPNHQKK
jgi:hypothetical protein